MGKTLRTAFFVLLIVAAFGGGYALGAAKTFRWMMATLSAETTGNLSRGVETLAHFRIEDDAGAIALLENAVDTATETLPQGQSYSQLPPSTQKALQIAKVYREAYPPENPPEALSGVLKMIPMPEL